MYRSRTVLCASVNGNVPPEPFNNIKSVGGLYFDLDRVRSLLCGCAVVRLCGYTREKCQQQTGAIPRC